MVSYLGLNPREYSSGGRQRVGGISRQGNTMLGWLLVEAAQTAARFDPELCRKISTLLALPQRGHIGSRRHLAVRLYWKLRQRGVAAQPVGMPGSSGGAVVWPQEGS